MLEQQRSPSEALTVSVLNSQSQVTNKPLRDSVKQALRNYLSQLDGQDVNDLYELVLAEVEHPMLDMIMQIFQLCNTPAVTKPVQLTCSVSTVVHCVRN